MGVVIYTDGGARGNPGPAGAGVIIYNGDPATGSGQAKKVAEVSEFLGTDKTNNWAEYAALILALQEAEQQGLSGKDIEIRMDSELIVKQMRGEYRIKEPSLKAQAQKVKALLVHFGVHTFRHVPRERNAEADRLVNDAIDSAL